MRCYLMVFCFAVFCVNTPVALAGSGGFWLPLPSFMTYDFSVKPQMFHFKGTDVTLNIPISYVDLPQRFKAQNEVQDLLLLALLPDLVSRNAQNTKEFDRGGNPDFLTILISAPTDKPFNLKRIADAYSNESWHLSIEDLGIVYGLNARRQLPPDKGHWSLRRLYRDSWDDNLTVAIACNGEGEVPSPGCDQHFLYKGLLIYINYRAVRVAQWHEIQSKIIAKFDSWSVK